MSQVQFDKTLKTIIPYLCMKCTDGGESRSLQNMRVKKERQKQSSIDDYFKLNCSYVCIY